jgi:hypothetical protein
VWFPTPTKLDAAIKALLERMGNVHLRAEQIIEITKPLTQFLVIRQGLSSSSPGARK